MSFYANLHTHSTHSDGKYSPRELAETAKAEGYRALAITDHDTATAYPELKTACDELGLECLFGVEFTAPSELLRQPNGSCGMFHMLGFHFDPNYPAMKTYLEQMSHRETHQTETLFRRGVAEGKLQGITWQEVLEYNRGITWLCNEHLFRAMKAKGLVSDLDYRAFFRELFGPRRDEVPPSYPFKQVEEIVALIRAAGGVAVVAHPHRQLQHIDALMAMGVEGLEAWHPDLTPEEQEEAHRIGLEKGLYISGGSDHRGQCGGMYATYEHPEESKSYLPPCSVGTTREHYEELRDRTLRR